MEHQAERDLPYPYPAHLAIPLSAAPVALVSPEVENLEHDADPLPIVELPELNVDHIDAPVSPEDENPEQNADLSPIVECSGLHVDHSDAPEVVPFGNGAWLTSSEKYPAHLYSLYPEAVYPNQNQAHLVYDGTPEAVSPSSDLYSKDDPEQNGLIHIPQNEEKIVAEPDASEKRRKKTTICGFSFPVYALCIVALAVLLITSLGAGLGAALHKMSNNAPGNATYGGYTVRGSGIAQVYLGSHILYFQHYTGQIRYFVLNGTTWMGGAIKYSVTDDGKAATPIMVETVKQPNLTSVHMFYISHTNAVREIISTDNGQTWIDGPLNGLLNATNSDAAALRSCSGYNNTGIYIWVATGPTTIQEALWTVDSQKWELTETITANGLSSLGCYTWGPNTLEYLFPINFDSQINFLWRDRAQQNRSWANSSAIISGVMSNTSVGFTDSLFVQLGNGSIAGFDVTFDGANSAVGGINPSYLLPQAYAGTAFSLAGINKALTMMSHKNGTDLVQSIFLNNAWTASGIAIPSS